MLASVNMDEKMVVSDIDLSCKSYHIFQILFQGLL